MQPRDLYRHCPSCGAARQDAPGASRFECVSCGFCLYFNPAVAVAALIEDAAGRWLWIRRAQDPARGLLSLPGGFVEIGETAEAALARELREELALTVQDLRYLESQPNQYHYRGVTYPVLDFYFLGKIQGEPRCAQPEEVAGIEWLKPADTRLEELAFDSQRAAWAHLLERLEQTGKQV